jgi:hypothetical protein
MIDTVPTKSKHGNYFFEVRKHGNYTGPVPQYINGRYIHRLHSHPVFPSQCSHPLIHRKRRYTYTTQKEGPATPEGIFEKVKEKKTEARRATE